jgi:hypothetical protein
MPTNHCFRQRFAASIVNILSCADRVIFKGYLPFGDDNHLNGFVDHCLKMLRKDFLPFVQEHSEALVRHAQQLAAKAGARYERLQGKHNKEKLIQSFLRQRRSRDGLVAVLCTQECCRTVKLLHAQGRPRLTFRLRPQRVLYFYILDPQFGLIHLRLQTWFPFTMQVYVNGHDWLARQMAKERLGFVQQDNAFIQVDDPDRAQQLAERFAHLDWVQILGRWARHINPLLRHAWLRPGNYYWVIDQAEYSTDVLFRDRAVLAKLYPRLLDHALLHFSASDILTFLGRRLHPRFDGEVLTDCKKDRLPGARIKHRVKNNWLKMYDKFAQILRIETVINQPREFKVRRQRLRHGRQQLVWCPMNKGAANFYHYQDVARAANQRYLDALAAAHLPNATAKQADRLCEPIRYRDRTRRGLNVLRDHEQRLFRAVLQGHHRLLGLCNRDVANALYGPQPSDPKARQRRTARVCRQLQLLRAHGLIAKIPHSQRYRVTSQGEAIMGSALYLRHKFFHEELQDIA